MAYVYITHTYIHTYIHIHKYTHIGTGASGLCHAASGGSSHTLCTLTPYTIHYTPIYTYIHLYTPMYIYTHSLLSMSDWIEVIKKFKAIAEVRMLYAVCCPPHHHTAIPPPR
jgi:hypothetical protein